MAAEVALRVAIALVVVVAAGQITAKALSRLGQPAVIGEVISGILLGPSLLGLLAPSAEAILFPAEVRPALGFIAQVGVILYMFLVGLEFDRTLLKRRAASLALTSQAAMAVPFTLGFGLALVIYDGSAPPGVPRTIFALFIGVALSITAFPVLARILTDRNLTRSELGAAALTCAAINDVMAWGLLAVVVGVARAMPTSGVPGEFVIAFAAGAIIPSSSTFARVVVTWAHGPVTLLLLPAFFALTGLRTQIGLLSSSSDWIACASIVAVATAGKLGGTAVAARMSGLPWRFSAQLGALMNTRGLMELIVLTIGLQAGMITPRLFAMLVIMAIVTTAMTAPLLDALGRGERTLGA